MFISCEKCSTTYTLDDRLISPGGTPVQCTRCGQVFTARPAPPPPAPAPSPSLAPPQATLVFGHGAAAEATPFQRSQTQVFGRGAAAEATSFQKGQTQVFGRLPASPAPPPAPPVAAPPPSVELPPEQPLLDLGLNTSEGADPAGTSSSPRRLRRALGLWALAALAAFGGWAGMRILRRPKSFPPEALEQRAHALNLLRPDDASARAEAQRMLRSVVDRHPGFVGAHADYLLVLTLDWDEAQEMLTRTGERAARLEREKGALEAAQQPVDWQNRANALADSLAELGREREPLAQRERALGAEAKRVFSLLQAMSAKEPPASDAPAWLRGQALYWAVRGSDAGVELARRYRDAQPPHAGDGWSEVALAEYVLHADAPAELMREAVQELRELKARDSEFLRAQVLLARLAWRSGDGAAAQAALEAVVTLNPRHRFAQELLTVAQEPSAPVKP